jgi:hypothetical protein
MTNQVASSDDASFKGLQALVTAKGSAVPPDAESRPLEMSDLDALEMEEICLALFDSWCETRSVLPIAYLMHAWPIVDRSRFGAVRLAATLRDLIKFHPQSVSAKEKDSIVRVIELAVV